MIADYPETHQNGRVDVHNRDLIDAALATGGEVDFGVQIAWDGRVWVCVNGMAFLRFKPARKEVSDHGGYGISDDVPQPQ